MSLYGGIEITGKPDLENIRRLDLLAIPCAQDMMRIGMAIDKEWFYDLSGRLDHELKELRRNICDFIPVEKLEEFMAESGIDDTDGDEYAPMNVNSRVQLSKLLFKTLRIGEGKALKMTKSGDMVSTGKRQLEQLKREHPILPLVLTYREYHKLKSTYTDKLPELAVLHKAGLCERCSWFDEGYMTRMPVIHDADCWVVHTTLLWTRTNTGRMASKSPNLQNQPVRSKLGRESRKGFVARPGKKLVSCDFSQIQLRFLAHNSQDPTMIFIFENGLDIHNMTAMEAFGLEKEEDIDPLSQRAPAKNVNFAIAFGETPRGLYDQLVSDSYGKSGIPVPDWLTLDWCAGFMERWHAMYSQVQPYMEEQFYRARRYGCVWDMFGAVRWIPEVQAATKKTIAEGLRYAGNQPIQAPDSGVTKLAMAEFRDTTCLPLLRDGVWCWPVITVHDELIAEVDEEYAQMVAYRMEEIMTNVLRDKETGEEKCRVPIKAESKVMDRWSK